MLKKIIRRINIVIGYFLFKVRYPGVKLIQKNNINTYYSQEGQDYYLSGLLFNLFEEKKGRVIVDVGCNDPIKFSNSYFFEKFLNCKIFGIEPLHEFKLEWSLKRPIAVFKNAAIGYGDAAISLRIPIGASELNMFSYVDGRGSSKLGNQEYQERTVELITLKNYFIDNLIKDVAILFIDVEGMELEVLKTIDFDKVVIRAICFENNSNSYFGSNIIRNFLIAKGYYFHARISNLDDIFLHESVKNGFYNLN